VSFDSERYPRFSAAADYVREQWRILHGALDSLEQLDPEALDRCERTVEMLHGMHPEKEDRERALDALAHYTVAYLREQVQYSASGTYSKTSFEEAAAGVYLDDELMSTMYLPGLFLTQAFWPVHVVLGSLFEDRFLPLIPDHGTAIEIGTGHGWTFTRTLQARESLRGAGFDFSPSSLRFTESLATANGVGADRFALERGDVIAGLPFPDAGAVCGVMGEVLEHVEDPVIAAKELRRCLVRGAAAFVTTAIDSPAIDHITNWPDAETVDAMLRDVGFGVVERHLLRPADFVTRKTRFVDSTKNYIAIVRAR